MAAGRFLFVLMLIAPSSAVRFTPVVELEQGETAEAAQQCLEEIAGTAKVVEHEQEETAEAATAGTAKVVEHEQEETAEVATAGTAAVARLVSRFSNVHIDTACRTDWAGTWSASPARSFFTGNLTVTQVGCNVTENWWEFVTDWQCRGHWVTGWIQIRSDYTARGQEIIPISRDDCAGHEGWRPSKMVLAADGRKATCASEIWTREPSAPPKPPLPSCLPLGECAIGFLDGFGPPCCDGLVLQQDYSSACHHPAGKYGYPEGGISCQKKPCLEMGADCVNNREDCCPGLSCHDEGISGFMCA